MSGGRVTPMARAVAAAVGLAPRALAVDRRPLGLADVLAAARVFARTGPRGPLITAAYFS